MYIKQVLKVEHDWWRYLIGFIAVLVGVGVFSIPHSVAVAVKIMDGSVDSTKLDDFEYLMTLFESNLNLVLILLPFLGGLLALLIIVKLLHKQSFRMLTTSREKIDWKRVGFAFVFWGVLSSGMILLDYYLEPDAFAFNFKLKPFLILCTLAIVLIPIQTSFEEYLFRGYFMQGLGVITRTKWFPLLFTSIVFGLLHITNPEVDKLGHIVLIYYIGTGLFLGVITLMDEGLELALGFHAANNLFTALLVTADWTAFQTHSVLKDLSDPKEAVLTDVLIPVLIIFPMLILIFSKIYRWTGWKEKLVGSVYDFPEDDIDSIGRTSEPQLDCRGKVKTQRATTQN
jgi:membrane protease YdiL (CAAX protease family)